MHVAQEFLTGRPFRPDASTATHPNGPRRMLRHRRVTSPLDHLGCKGAWKGRRERDVTATYGQPDG